MMFLQDSVTSNFSVSGEQVPVMKPGMVSSTPLRGTVRLPSSHLSLIPQISGFPAASHVSFLITSLRSEVMQKPGSDLSSVKQSRRHVKFDRMRTWKFGH